MAPRQKPGLSKQDYQTPPEFLEALKDKLGIDNFAIDLAATQENSVSLFWYGEGTNSLTMDWDTVTKNGWAFCNPPFAHIEPWVRKAYSSSANIAMLLPASVGSNWWRNWVDGRAYVLFLNGRITFVGEDTGYPKDCAVLLYTNWTQGGNGIWTWNK